MHKTPLFEAHRQAGGKMVDFHGWALPLHYGSQLAEHHAVRQDAGLFDVSHMTVFDISGAGAWDFFNRLLPSDARRLKEAGRALYSALLNENGGIIDDLMLYALPDERLRLVTNCATRARVQSWLKTQTDGDARAPEIECKPLAILALQGPKALAAGINLLPEHATTITALLPFRGAFSGDVWLAKTGYTGESGLEIIAPEDEAVAIWTKLMAGGVQPAGLGARDTLRLEAGLNLYGQDMDETTSPLVCGLEKIIHWTPEGHDFIGRQALEQEQRFGPAQKLVGLALEVNGIPRQGYRVLAQGVPCGRVTSGAMSPTLKKGIAFARIEQSALNQPLSVEIRGSAKPATRQKMPFYRKPKPR